MSEPVGSTLHADHQGPASSSSAALAPRTGSQRTGSQRTGSQRTGSHLGIGLKLLIAFGAIVATTVVAVGVGWWSNRQLADRLSIITRDSVPALNAASRLAQQGAIIVAAGNRLNGARGDGQRSEAMQVIVGVMSDFDASLDSLRGSGVDPEGLKSVAALEADLKANIAALDVQVSTRLVQAAGQRDRLANLRSAHEDLIDAITEPLDKVALRVSKSTQSLDSSTNKAVTSLTRGVIDHLVPLFETQRGLGEIMTATESAIGATSPDQVDRFWQSYVPAVTAISRNMKQIATADNSDDFLKATKAFLDVSQGDNDIFDLMRIGLDPTKPAGERQDNVTRARQTLGRLSGARDAVLAAIDPLLTGTRIRIIVEGNDLVGKTRTSIEDLTEVDIAQFRLLLMVSASTNYIVGLLNEGGNTLEATRLPLIRQRTEAAAKELEAYAAKLKEVPELAPLAPTVLAIAQLGQGANSIPVRQSARLALMAEADTALARNTAIAEQLGTLVEQVVGSVRAGVDSQSKMAEEQSATAQTSLLIVGALSVVVAILIVWLYVGRSIVRRLLRLAATMRALAAGDLTVEPPKAGSDEIGQMADALQIFRANALEVRASEARTAAERERANEERRHARLELADSFEASVKKVVDQVSGAVASLRDVADGVSRTAEQTTREAGEAATASQQATISVKTVAAAAEELLASINEISRQVQRSSEVATRAVRDAERTNDTVEGLSTAANRIGEVVELINQIAAQTNLLALNATIEAARAGDAGKGFAVVASEVKNLAGQTAKATEEISAQINAVQASTAEAVIAIKGISGTIGQINEIAAIVASAVEQQGAATQEIARNVSEAAEGTSQASTTIQSVSAAAVQTGESASIVQSAAMAMSGHADTLNREVGDFLTQIRA